MRQANARHGPDAIASATTAMYSNPADATAPFDDTGTDGGAEDISSTA